MYILYLGRYFLYLKSKYTLTNYLRLFYHLDYCSSFNLPQLANDLFFAEYVLFTSPSIPASSTSWEK